MRSDARKRVVEAAFAPVAYRQEEVEKLIREAKAEAWEEGYGEGVADWDGILLTAREVAAASNPYRAEGRDAIKANGSES